MWCPAGPCTLARLGPTPQQQCSQPSNRLLSYAHLPDPGAHCSCISVAVTFTLRPALTVSAAGRRPTAASATADTSSTGAPAYLAPTTSSSSSSRHPLLSMAGAAVCPRQQQQQPLSAPGPAPPPPSWPSSLRDRCTESRWVQAQAGSSSRSEVGSRTASAAGECLLAKAS